MTVDIKVKGKLPENAILIEAFPSKGYVSTIAANIIVKKLGMQEVGCITSDELTGIVVVHDSKPMLPIRIYAKDDLILITSELIIPVPLLPDFSKAIGAWIKGVKPREMILLASMSGIQTTEEHEIFWLSSDEKLSERMEKPDMKAKKLQDGVLTGISSGLMIECSDMKIPILSLMVETSYIPDALAAATLLEIIGKLIGMQIDVDELKTTGKKIEHKYQEMLEQLKKGQENYQDMAQLPMYR
ncbi:MAG: PAC2 family protein [Candidatus Altiarchaeota archaeon]|nr:PAC2 family protein [Candidatus Altiarchaeota archaeon]